jgi:SAM-dependent methyltransferase
MGLIGGNVGVFLLDSTSRRGTVGYPDIATAYLGRSKLEVLLGPTIWDQVRGRRVLDFGCGYGLEAIEMAEHGARHVIGVDLDEVGLKDARHRAAEHGVADRCVFVRESNEHVDVILSLDSFEHFADPAAILGAMSEQLNDGGRVLVSFGPTWYHPLGGHLFSVFPWSHLLFAEPALIRWRSRYKTDGANSIEEAGLNRMTVGRFQRLVANSPLCFESFEAVPIRRVRWLHNGWTREFATACVKCTLVHRASQTRSERRL